MSLKSKDPLLAVANILLCIFIGGAIAFMVLVAIYLGAALTVGRSGIASRVAAAGLGDGSHWVVIAAMVAVGAQLFLGLRFLLELNRIVTALEAGAPFVAQNAKRLARMGWLALAFQFIAIPARAAIAVYDQVQGGSTEIPGPSLGGFVLVLTLFILARVFRVGNEQREDLEGTV